jgi:hypothetical protein
MSGRLARVVVLGAALLPAPAVSSAVDPLPPGRYRLELAIAAHSALPVAGRTRSVTRSVSDVEIAVADGRLVQTHRVCAMWIDELPPWGGLVFPHRFVDSLAARSAPVELARRGTSWHYRADLGLEQIGYLADGDGALPADAASPSVVDSDGDGRPGATVLLSIAGLGRAELWLVQRARSELSGTVVSPGRVEGAVRVPVFEQRVIGARPGFFQRTPATRVDADGSTFTLVRAETDERCAVVGGLGPESAS